MINKIITQNGIHGDVLEFAEKVRKEGKIMDSNIFDGDGSIFAEMNGKTYIIQIRNNHATKCSKCSMETYYEN